MRHLAACLLGITLLAGSGWWVPGVAADETPCSESAELGDVHVVCNYSAADLREERTINPEADWAFHQMCTIDSEVDLETGACFSPRICTTAALDEGTLYGVRRDGEFMGYACLTASEAGELNAAVPLRVLVAEAFKNLHWPQSELSVQPPGGKTLVNLPTIFFTTNDHATTRTVTLVGQQVTVEAWPQSYTWHFGDDSSQTTSSPGHPHPEEDVTHTYARKGEVSVGVDTTYRGRWRLGDGAWSDIADTLTVVGNSQDLAILEARPELVVE